MKVSEQFIASLLARVDLVEVIGKKVLLRRAGANFIGLCPFHQEKTPSFTVNPSKQFFHCFGCKKSGDAIQFLMETDHQTFIDSVETLANHYGLQLEKEVSQPVDPKIEQIYKILEIAVEFYHQELFKEHITAKTALNYLTNRGINLATIQQFKLGVVNNNWTTIFDVLSKSYEPALLQQAGLVIEKNGKFYDRFRSRIMFPIRNKSGKTIGFGARALNLEQEPKYLNSPETIVFKKNHELYGLDVVKSKLKQIDNLLIVEGYLDVLTLMQSGINQVVATLGTAFNDIHLKIITNITSDVIFCFDGDVAGYKATIRAMEICINMMALGIIQSKHVIKFVLLPTDYDPDLFVREKGCQEFKNYIQEAVVLSDFFFNYLTKKYPAKTIESLNQLAEEAKSYIVKIQDSLLQSLWYQKLAKLLGVENNFVNKNLNNNKYFNNKIIKTKANYKNYPIVNASRALAMLVSNVELLKFCNLLNIDRFSNIKLPIEVDLLIKVIKLIDFLNLTQDNKQDNDKQDICKYLAANLEPVYAQKLLSIDINKIMQFTPVISKDGMEQEFIGAVKRINRELIEQLVEELLELAKNRMLEDQEKILLQQMLKEL